MNSEFSIIKDADPKQVLFDFSQFIASKSTSFIGYPESLAFDYSAIRSLLNYHINNIGDPRVPGYFSLHSRKFEQAVLSFRAKKFGLHASEPAGYVGCSGSESNMRGLYLAKKVYHNTGILYYSADTHYSIRKAADMMSMETVIVKSLPHGEIDYDDLEVHLKKSLHRPAIFNLNIGTTVKGAIDNLDRVLAIIKHLGITQHHIHLDCALTGGYLPFLDDQTKPDIGFHKPIKSLALSGHKFIGSPVPCGIVLAQRNVADVVKEMNASSYIGSPDTTIMGSRSGHAPVFMRYALQTVGEKGLQERIQQCFHNTMYLQKKLTDHGIQTLVNPHSITVVFPRPAEELVRKRSLASKDAMSHVVVMPHVTKEVLDRFIAELCEDKNVYKPLVLS